jgi:hypothetical protein
MKTPFYPSRYLYRAFVLTAFLLCLLPFAWAQSVSDVDSAIIDFEQRLANGQFPTNDMKQSWWKANGDPYVNFLSKYSGLSSSAVTVLLGGNTEGAGVLPTVSTALDQLGLATTVYDVASKLCEGKPNSRTLAFLSGAKYYLGNVLSKRGAAGSLMNAGVGFIDYSLTSLGDHAVELSNLKWWKAYCEFQSREHPDPKGWLLLIQEGGGVDALAAQLDRFWEETEEVRGEDFFKTNNKDHVVDYRNRFLREQVFPAVKSWAEIEKVRAANALKAAVLSEGLKLQTARVRISGDVINSLDSYSQKPERYLVSIDGRQDKEEISGGHFEFAIPLRDFSRSPMTVRIRPVGTCQRFDVAYGSAGLSVAPGEPMRCSPGVKIKVWKDGTVVATLPAFRVSALFGERTRLDLPPGHVDVPPMPGDANDKIEGPAKEARAAYAAGKLSFELARAQVHSQLDQVSVEASRQWEGMENRSQALRRNTQLECAALNAQKQHAQSDALYRRTEEDCVQLRKLVDERTARREAFATEMRDWEKAEEDSFRKRNRDLEMRLQAITQEVNRMETEYRDSEGELMRLVGAVEEVAWMTSRKHTEGQNSDPMDDYAAREALQQLGDSGANSADPEAVLAEKMPGMISRFDEAYARYLERSEAWKAVLQRLEGLNSEKGELEARLRGVNAEDFPCGAGNFLPSYAESFMSSVSSRIQQCRDFSATVPDKRIKADAPRIIAAVKRRGIQRSACTEELDRLEALLKSPGYPSAEQLSAAVRDYQPVGEAINSYMGYLKALLDAKGESPDAPAGILDAKGGDSAFVGTRLAALRAFIDANRNICGDLLPGELKESTDYSSALALRELLAPKANILTQANRERWYKVNQAISLTMSQRRLYTLTHDMSFLLFIEPLGSSPGERITSIRKIAAVCIDACRREAAALAATGALPENISDRDLDEAVSHLKSLLVDAEKAGGLPRACCPFELLEARATLRQAVSATKRLDLWRKRHSLPEPPTTVTICGQAYPLDGRLVRIKLSSFPPREAKNQYRMIRCVFAAPAPLGVELSAFGNPFWKSFDNSLQFSIAAADETHPTIYEMSARSVAPSGRNSWIEGDPACLTLVIEP